MKAKPMKYWRVELCVLMKGASVATQTVDVKSRGGREGAAKVAAKHLQPFRIAIRNIWEIERLKPHPSNWVTEHLLDLEKWNNAAAMP